jgi:hypothetical protein
MEENPTIPRGLALLILGLFIVRVINVWFTLRLTGTVKQEAAAFGVQREILPGLQASSTEQLQTRNARVHFLNTAMQQGKKEPCVLLILREPTCKR